MSQERTQVLTQTQQPLRKSLLDRLRDEVLDSPTTPVAVLNDKSEDLLEMERIIKSVYKVIMMANPTLKKYWTPEDIKSLIEEHAILFLKNYALVVCRKVSEPIVSLRRVPFNSFSTFLDFNELCKTEQKLYEEYLKSIEKEREAAIKKESPKKSAEPRSLAKILKDIMGAKT